MQRHQFGFGSAVQASQLTKATGFDADNYRMVVKTHFNKVVFENDMKWQQWEAAGGPKAVQDAVGWLRTNGVMRIRGHNLVWPSLGYCPADVSTLSGTALVNRVLAHIDNESQYFRVRTNIEDWDVVNEPYTNFSLLNKINGITSGRGTVAQEAAVMKTWFDRTAADDPLPSLYLNDAGVVENPPG